MFVVDEIELHSAINPESNKHALQFIKFASDNWEIQLLQGFLINKYLINKAWFILQGIQLVIQL